MNVNDTRYKRNGFDFEDEMFLRIALPRSSGNFLTIPKNICICKNQLEVFTVLS